MHKNLSNSDILKENENDEEGLIFKPSDPRTFGASPESSEDEDNTANTNKALLGHNLLPPQ